MDRASAIRYFWNDRFTVIVREKATNPTTKITGFSDSIKYEDQSGKLSFKALDTAGRGDFSSVAQTVKLFCDPALDIPAGSKISVTHAGRAIDYARSGEPAIYTDHQEILLELFNGWV